MCMWVRRIQASASASQTLCARERQRERERERERERQRERARTRARARERKRARASIYETWREKDKRGIKRGNSLRQKYWRGLPTSFVPGLLICGKTINRQQCTYKKKRQRETKAHSLIKMPSMQPITFLKTPKHLTHLVNADSSTADGLSYTRFTHGESSVVEGRRRTGAGFVGDGCRASSG